MGAGARPGCARPISTLRNRTFPTMADDARSLPNTALLETSFLYGANTAYVEEMHARYLADPSSVDPSWRSFFENLKDAPEDVRRGLEGPSWGRSSAERENGAAPA